MYFKNLISKAIPAFVGVILIVAGCSKSHTSKEPDPDPDPEPEPTVVNHFQVKIDDITTVSCMVSITKDDADARFYYALSESHSFDDLAGDTFQEKAKAYYEGELDFLVNDYGMTYEEALNDVTSKNDLIEFPIEYLRGNTKCTVIVAYISEDGKVASDFERYDFKTAAPEPSSNTFTVELSDIRARAAHVKVTVTNSDQYSAIIVPASSYEGLDGDELIDRIIYMNMYMLNPRFESFDEDYENLEADTEYILAVFGFTDYAATTSHIINRFTTREAGDPKKWSFTAEFTDGTYKGYKLNASITPNDDTIDYVYECVAAEYTADEFLKQYTENMEAMLKNIEGFTKKDYLSLFASHGPSSYEDYSVVPGKSYKIAAIPVEPKTLDFCGVVFSDVFKVETPEASEVTISVDWSRYFDGDELAKEYPETEVAYYANQAVFNPTITTEASSYLYGIAVDSGKSYSKDDIIYFLMENGYSFKMECLSVPFDRAAILYAVAVDDEGKFGPVFEKKFTMTRSGATPAKEYYANSSASVSKSGISKKADVKSSNDKKAAAERLHSQWNFTSSSKPSVLR